MTLTRKREIEQETMRILSSYRIFENPGKNLQKIIAGEKIVLIDYHDWSEEICGRFLFIDNEPAIFYNAKHTEAMQAFTIMFVIIGDDGAPCGSFPFKQAICAIVVAASSPMEYGGFISIPRTRPK